MASIPINLNDARKQYVAAAGQTVFDYDFPVFDATHIKVMVGSQLLESSAFEVSGVGAEAGGAVTLDTGCAADDVVTIWRDVPPERASRYQVGGDLKADVLNLDFSLQIMMMQELSRDLARVVRLADEDTRTSAPRLPAFEAGKALVWSADGGLANSVRTPDEDPGASAAASAAAAEDSAIEAASNANTALAAVVAAENAQTAAEQTAASLPVRLYFSGFEMTNNASDLLHDIDISAGVARSDDDTANLSGAAMTKRLDAAWSAGTGGGFLDTGSIAANTGYYMFVIGKADGTTDFLASASLAAPSLPTGYTKKRRIGWMFTDSSSHVYPFKTIGDETIYRTSVHDAAYSSSLPSGYRNIAVSVPAGVQVGAKIGVIINSASNEYANVHSPEETNEPVGGPDAAVFYQVKSGGARLPPVITDTSRNVRLWSFSSGATLILSTHGFIDFGRRCG